MDKSRNSAILGFFRPKADNPTKKTANGFCNGILTFCNAVAIEHTGGRSGKYLIAPFGDWKNGGVVQRIDMSAAEILTRNLGSIWSRVKNVLGNACPVYFEHPDHEDGEDIPTTADKTPYGRVRSLETRADGIYANIEWLDGFEALPKHLQISPRWNAVEIAENIVRPSRLISIGLTAHPNIKATAFVNSTTQTKEINMDKEILKLLGYSEDEAQKIIDKTADAPTDVLERLRAALTEKAALSNDLEAAKKDGEEKEKQLEATKTELANSQAALKKSQAARAELVVANAIRSGKIIEAQRRSAVKILANSDDFETDEAELAKAPAAVKTESKTDGIAAAENAGEKAKSDLRAKFDAYVKEKTAEYGGTQSAYDRAWKEAEEKFEGVFGGGE